MEVVVVRVPVLLTVAERKTMASMQRRLGPNIALYYGLLQTFADALKLFLKEYVSFTQTNILLLFVDIPKLVKYTTLILAVFKLIEL